VYGSGLLVAPKTVLRLIGGSVEDRVLILAARALGVRHLLQAAWTVLTPTRRVARLGAVADVLHAMSVLPVVAFDASRRRSVAIDVVVEAALGGAGALEAAQLSA